MQQSLIIKQPTIQKQLKNKEKTSPTIITKFTFNISEIDALFPGFSAGDFAVLYGPKSIASLTSLFCVRAQLPPNLGGLGSNVVFIDCANSSSLSNIGYIAEHQHLDAKAALERVFSMRVYTAYRLTSLIMEKLKDAVESQNAKLVVISEIAGPFLHDNVDDQEARTVYSQIMSYLSNFAKKHHIIIIATYSSPESSNRNSALQEITSAKASTVLRFTKTPYTKEVELEKHPSYMLGVADLTSENHALSDFIGSDSASKNYILM